VVLQPPTLCCDGVGGVLIREVMPEKAVKKGVGFRYHECANEADKAVSTFNTEALSDHTLKVTLAKPGESRGTTNRPDLEP
jgi:hypothetical protein